MDILSMEHLAGKGSQKNRRHFSVNSSGTNSKPEKSSRRNTKYIKLYELTQAATAPVVCKAKEPRPTAKLGKSTVKTQFQKSIASDLDMRKELENRDKIAKDYRKKMLKISSSIVDTFFKESIKGEKSAPVDKLKEQPIAKLRKLTAKSSFQRSIASDLDMRKELENRNKVSKDYREKMLKICSSVVDTFLKELVKGAKTAPVDKPKERLIAKLGKSTVPARFQKNIASDLCVKKELDNGDTTEKAIRKIMLTMCSNIVDTFLKESVETSAVVDRPRKQAIYKSTGMTHFQNSIASDHGKMEEFENRDKMSEDYGKRMLDLCVVGKYLKEFAKAENLLM